MLENVQQKTIIFLAMLGFVFFFVIAGANQLVNPFLQKEFGISLSQAGYYTTVWGVGVVLEVRSADGFMERLG
jgi:PAT family beta-lactamase induction signal transducer AmpG